MELGIPKKLEKFFSVVTVFPDEIQFSNDKLRFSMVI